MKTDVRIFNDQSELAWQVATELRSVVNESASVGKSFAIALSGGSTPKILFGILGDHFSDKIPWSLVHLFWGDERCVPPDDPESNFGMTKKALFDKINIPSANIHRIIGENNPSQESLRYSNEILGFTNLRDGFPVFDLVLLGLGEDGHTASIFPGNNQLFLSKNICETAFHPTTYQKRITLSGKVINNADSIIFLVTGENKADVVSSILEKKENHDYPASLINPQHGILKWYLDKDASKTIDRNYQSI